MAEPKLFALDDRDDEPYGASSLGERDVFTSPSDPDVETLLKRIKSGQLVLRPTFQRTDVWNVVKKSKLVESLLLNLPIPPCFFAEDREGVRVVVDGQQRLRAVDDFRQDHYRLTGLQVMSELNGARWSDLSSELKRKLLQRVIRTLVITHHTSPELRFEIFERLNTGGEPLTDQEIRNGTLSGELNTLLDELASHPLFLHLMGRRSPDARLRHHELVLRYLALSEDLSAYFPPLKFFLSEFMRKERDPGYLAISRMRHSFLHTLEACDLVFGELAFRRFRIEKNGEGKYERVTNRAVFDIQMLGFTGVEHRDLQQHRMEIISLFTELASQNNEFIESLTRATDHRSRLTFRLDAWFNGLRTLGMNIPLFEDLPVL